MAALDTFEVCDLSIPLSFQSSLPGPHFHPLAMYCVLFYSSCYVGLSVRYCSSPVVPLLPLLSLDLLDGFEMMCIACD